MIKPEDVKRSICISYAERSAYDANAVDQRLASEAEMVLEASKALHNLLWLYEYGTISPWRSTVISHIISLQALLAVGNTELSHTPIR